MSLSRAEDIGSIRAIMKRVVGYSDQRHYEFFKWLFQENPQIKKLLILGVYHGRDICFMLDVLKRYHPGRIVRITGVDKFNDKACADWPEDKKQMNWEEAGFGRAPTFNEAILNTTSDDVVLIQQDDETFLKETGARFDCVYLDTSHDEATVKRQLSQVRRVCNKDAILCGDDYSNQGTWGVVSAVEDAFTTHNVFAGWIWNAKLEDLKT